MLGIGEGGSAAEWAARLATHTHSCPPPPPRACSIRRVHCHAADEAGRGPGALEVAQAAGTVGRRMLRPAACVPVPPTSLGVLCLPAVLGPMVYGSAYCPIADATKLKQM